MDGLLTLLRTFLDSVLVPPIPQGVGRAETLLFLDGNHSKGRAGKWMLESMDSPRCP